MKKFDLSQIKEGYLLVVKDTSEPELISMTVSVGYVSPGSEETGLACCCPGKQWWPLKKFDQDGKWAYFEGSAEIMAIYGPTIPRLLLDNSIAERELLWERKAPQEKGPKKMTVSEVCEALGYDVEIVKEG